MDGNLKYRSFMVRSGKTGVCYCGKCGKRQLNDRYNMRKHAELCGFEVREEDDVILVDEGSGWGYYLDTLPGCGAAGAPGGGWHGATGATDAPGGGWPQLRLRICEPRLIPVRGFADRCSGMEWVPIFEVLFPAGSRNPDIIINETGFEMDVLLSLIRAGRIVPISRESDAEVIRRVFPCIDIYTLQMFVHIYKNKGYSTAAGIRPATERWLFEKTPDGEEWQNAAPRAVPGAMRRQQFKIPMHVLLYRHGGERYILQVVLKKRKEQIVFLFTRGYCSCSKKVDLKEILGQQYYYAGNAMSAIAQFDKAYPEYHLAAYAERSDNILIPLLAADYHTGMELAAKSGAAGIAESYDKLAKFEKTPCLYRNLRELFGVPVSVLKALDREQVCDAVMDRMKEIFEYRPAFLQFEAYTASMMEFYKRADITHNGMRGIDGIAALNDKQILQILRYLEKHPNEGHYYCDYMNACAQLGEYPYGITPNVPIMEAHDRTVARIRNKQDIRSMRSFTETVMADEYRRLATCLNEKEEKIYEKDPFLVTVPVSSDDLFRESENMHNCVRIYVSRVASGQTRIYFLRQKNEPEKSFGTLEVSGDGKRLRQAKAFANHRLDLRAQKFIVKWCRCKGIRINTMDVADVPYTA